jgi:hypothetical protein
MDDLNIYQRMSKVTEEITNVAKNLAVGTGQSSYKAVGEADVLAAVKPAERKYGIYSYPYSREITESGILEKETKYGTSKQIYLRIMTTYRFVNMEKPEEYLDITSLADGVDSNDKAPGKAMTYADKYALLKAYKIITGDDPDQNASEPLKSKELREESGSSIIDSTKKKILIDALKKHGYESPNSLESLKGLVGYGQVTIDLWSKAMKEMGEQ